MFMPWAVWRGGRGGLLLGKRRDSVGRGFLFRLRGGVALFFFLVAWRRGLFFGRVEAWLVHRLCDGVACSCFRQWGDMTFFPGKACSFESMLGLFIIKGCVGAWLVHFRRALQRGRRALRRRGLFTFGLSGGVACSCSVVSSVFFLLLFILWAVLSHGLFTRALGRL